MQIMAKFLGSRRMYFLSYIRLVQFCAIRVFCKLVLLLFYNWRKFNESCASNNFHAIQSKIQTRLFQLNLLLCTYLTTAYSESEIQIPSILVYQRESFVEHLWAGCHTFVITYCSCPVQTNPTCWSNVIQQCNSMLADVLSSWTCFNIVQHCMSQKCKKMLAFFERAYRLKRE